MQAIRQLRQLRNRRRRRGVPVRSAPVTTTEIESMLEWIAAEMRAERAWPWYRACGPSRFIARFAATTN